MGIEEKQEFLRQLYIEHSKWLFSLARRRVNDYHLAEDVVQEVFAIAQKKIDGLIKHDSPAGWLYVTTYRVAYHELKKSYHKDLPLEDRESGLAAAQSEPSLAELLPDDFDVDEKKLLVLRFEEQCSYAEISERCGISQVNCRQKMSRLKKKCRKIFENPQKLSQKMLDGR